jgi:toxin ParE1/3/4
VKIRYTLRALADLEAIFAYYDVRAPMTAKALRSAVERALGRLKEFPHIAPVTDEQGARVLTLTRYPYRIYYELDAEAEEITILHVRHARRRPWQRTK